MQIETVLLDTMSGFEFEDFFAHLLTRLGRGQVEKVLFTQDEGRDILVRSGDGLIVVECKHHPNGSIGRPVVQKLHSALISSGAVRGILVTTGHFTKEALAYAKKISIPIEMVDRPLLTEMASRAGIRMVFGGQVLDVWVMQPPEMPKAKRGLGELLDSILTGSPRPANAMLDAVTRKVSYHPVYWVTYSVHADFSTSVGTIHREHLEQGSIAIDGATGKLWDKEVRDFILAEPQTPLLSLPKEMHSELPSFRLDAVTARDRARAAIAGIHTRTVRYRGRNNIRYEKVCTPGEREIFVSDIRQLQFPSSELEFNLLTTRYSASVLQGPSGRLLSKNDNVTECRVCKKDIDHDALVCDACGRATHKVGLLAGQGHGYQCKKCGRTTCRFCGRWVEKWVFLMKPLCPSCALVEQQKGKKIYVFKPLKIK